MPEVRVLGGLRRVLGSSTVRARASVVRELLQELAQRGGAPAMALLFEKGGALPNRDLRILVNGRSIAFLEGLETKLGDEDAVTLHFTGARGFPGG
jgi:molybdopterin converting factor small subunit